MPGMYQAQDYDIAGFAVGIVEKRQMIDGKTIAPGGALIALASSGIHSNGYSLGRKIIDSRHITIRTTQLAGKPLADWLMTPTRIYVKPVLSLLQHTPVKGLVHITGGGFSENIPRILPDHCQAVIDNQSWQQGPLFDWLQQQGNVTTTEMRRTFNCGVGMILCVPAEHVEQSCKQLQDLGETAWHIGHIAHRNSDQPSVQFSGDATDAN